MEPPSPSTQTADINPISPVASATIAITIALSSPTLSLSASDTNAPFYITTTASTSHPSPITFNSGRHPFGTTALASPPPNSSPHLASPAFRGHAIRALVSESDPSKKIAWRRFNVSRARPVPPNFRDDEGFTWITVPAEGSVSVRHYLPRERFQEIGAEVGEVYVTSLDARISSAGMVWWSWGDLETDLRDKKFGYAGRKDGEGGVIEDGDEWAVKPEGEGGKLVLQHGAEVVRIEIVE